MQMKIFSVKDAAVQSFTQPFFSSHTGGATRSFVQEINNPQNDLFKHFTDLDLYEIGVFDDQTGRLQPYDDPQIIIRGVDAKTQN